MIGGFSALLVPSRLVRTEKRLPLSARSVPSDTLAMAPFAYSDTDPRYSLGRLDMRLMNVATCVRLVGGLTGISRHFLMMELASGLFSVPLSSLPFLPFCRGSAE